MQIRALNLIFFLFQKGRRNLRGSPWHESQRYFVYICICMYVWVFEWTKGERGRVIVVIVVVAGRIAIAILQASGECFTSLVSPRIVMCGYIDERPQLLLRVFVYIKRSEEREIESSGSYLGRESMNKLNLDPNKRKIKIFVNIEFW